MQTVNYKSVEIHPDANFQFWQEEDKTTGSRYVDFGKPVVYGNITLPNNTFLTLTGTIKQIDQAQQCFLVAPSRVSPERSQTIL
jgi:hypothetical protein